MLPNGQELLVLYERYASYVIPMIGLGVIGTVVIALIMWMKTIHVRMKWWRIWLSVLLIPLMQSFSFMYAIDLYRMLVMPEYYWSRFLVKTVYFSVFVVVLLASFAAVAWCFLPVAKYEHLRQ